MNTLYTRTDGRRACESFVTSKCPINTDCHECSVYFYSALLPSCTFSDLSEKGYFVHFLSPMLSFRYIFLSSSYRFWFKPPNPPMTSLSTSTTAGSWTAARAWTTSALTPPTPSCTPRAKPAACQGCFIWPRGANSPSESWHPTRPLYWNPKIPTLEQYCSKHSQNFL